MIDRSPWIRGLSAAGCIGALLFAVYVDELAGPFLFDDQHAIVQNATLRSLALLSPLPETPVAARPLVNASFALDYALHGLSTTAAGNSEVALAQQS